MNKGVTILVCVFNGKNRLPATLTHLAAQRIPATIGCEIVLVDNASTDGTAAEARQLWTALHAPFEMRIVAEPRQGLNYARETGIALARYEYVTLCDDDNWLNPGYVQRAFTLMEAQPKIGILGGHGIFQYETPAPHWLETFNLYAGGAQAHTSGNVRDNIVYGAGATLRKSAWLKLAAAGFKSSLTDRAGHQLTSGGDYELCYALALGGYEIWYDADLDFYHYITSPRLTLEYYLTYIEESADCFPVLEPMKISLVGRNGKKWHFRWLLCKSYGYHIKKLIGLLIRKSFSAGNPRNNMVTGLQYTLLKRQLRSYRQYSAMENHYGEVERLRINLQQISGTQDLLNGSHITVR